MKRKGGNKFYAVLTTADQKRSIYCSWPETAEHILGKSVQHKKFASHAAANDWLNKISGRQEETGVTQGNLEAKRPKFHAPGLDPELLSPFPVHHAPTKVPRYAENVPEDTMEVWTDGSHKKATGQRGAGGIVLCKRRELHWSVTSEFCSSKFDEQASNPTMELFAAQSMLHRIHAEVDWANGPKLIVVTADYEGVKRYADGVWKPKIGKSFSWFHEQARLLVEILRLLRPLCKVVFEHVSGHSGVYGNESADSLADCNQKIDELGELKNM